jgi:Xaa-Pro aminopeptidase
MINQRLTLLRAQMKAVGIDAYIIPSSDAHQSEYVANRWKSREWISGFTGSAGVAVVTADHAGLWTDSRYFLQGEQELEASEFILHKVYNQGSPQHIDWIMDTLAKGSVIGIDGNLISDASARSLDKKVKKYELSINYDADLIDTIWTDRAVFPLNAIFVHEERYTGMSASKKIDILRTNMKEHELSHYVASSLDDIAWLYNIRSSDIEFNPVVISFAVLTQDRAYLYIKLEKLDEDTKAYFEREGITTVSYDLIKHDLSALEKKDRVGVDNKTTSRSIMDAITGTIELVPNFVQNAKAIKNLTEIAHFRKVMEKDAVALLRTFMWLEENIKDKDITEYDVSEKLIHFRSQQEGYFGESFAAIVGYKSNGAIVHYRPDEHKSKKIEPEGILLIDSGGQYLDGTTDITRTLCLSTPTEEQKEAYTAVLRGHIALDDAIYPEGTKGTQLDILARNFLWQKGLNYLHGTGHGVGFFLNVHEAPQGFAPSTVGRANTVIQAGMVTSNEPGYYETGEYGIRIENLILTTASEKEGFLEHETLTLFPIDKQLVDETELDSKEKTWMNRYHKMVYDRVSPHLNEVEKGWLYEKCKPFG